MFFKAHTPRWGQATEASIHLLSSLMKNSTHKTSMSCGFDSTAGHLKSKRKNNGTWKNYFPVFLLHSIPETQIYQTSCLGFTVQHIRNEWLHLKCMVFIALNVIARPHGHTLFFGFTLPHINNRAQGWCFQNTLLQRAPSSLLIFKSVRG